MCFVGFFSLGNLFNYNKNDLILDDSLEDLGIYPELIQLLLLNVFSARCIYLLVLVLPVLLSFFGSFLFISALQNYLDGNKDEN